jgi:hypothetical protein
LRKERFELEEWIKKIRGVIMFILSILSKRTELLR